MSDHAFSAEEFLGAGEGRTLVALNKDDVIFSQGDSADAVFYLRSGAVKLKVNSPQGKEAVIALVARRRLLRRRLPFQPKHS